MNFAFSLRPLRNQTGQWHARLFIAPVLVLVLLSFNYLYWREQQAALDVRRSQAFERAVDRTLTTLSDRMGAYEMVLRGVKGFFDASDQITHTEFRAYVEALQLRHTRPGLQGIALLERVPPMVAQPGPPRVQPNLLPIDPPLPVDDTLTPDRELAGPGNVPAPVTHLQLLVAGNLELLGMEDGTRPPIREAMDRARDSGRLALTGPITYDLDGTATLAMYLPLYQPGLEADPTAVAERRTSVHGWVAAPFRAADIVGGLKDQLDPDVAIVIMDGPSLVGGSLVYGRLEDSQKGPGFSVALSSAVRSMDVGGRRWTIALSSLPAFERRFERSNHHAIALLGALLSLLAGWFVSTQASAHQRALALARDMTRELRSTRDALESTLNAVPDLLFEFGLDGHIHHYRSSRTDLLAESSEHFVGKRVTDVLPPSAAAACLAALQEAHATGYSAGRQYALEVAGGTRWFELSVARKEGQATSGAPRKTPQPSGDGPRFIALSRDVTSRREAENAMHQLAHFDALTGLPNRRMLLEALRGASQASAAGAGLAVGGLFYIDLDNFKQINDARGHTVGDSLLLQVGQRLASLA
ncbi:MAG: diguanylate cyclase, partial [Comamonadaceae bacterium]